MKFTFSRIAALLFAGLLFGAIAVAPANADTRSDWITVTVAATGAKLSLPSNWQSLQPAQLAQYGLVPDMPAPASTEGPVTTTKTEQGGGSKAGPQVHPNSAYVWNGSVYIGVTGAGLWVDEWYTQTAVIVPPICTFGVFWIDFNTIWHTTPQYCSENAIYWYHYTQLQFNRPTDICNTWIGVAGKPCVYVHT